MPDVADDDADSSIVMARGSKWNIKLCLSVGGMYSRQMCCINHDEAAVGYDSWPNT